MIFLGILLSIAAIGFFCWLLFTLAVFALPFFAGLSAGTWAWHTGAGWLGAIIIGIVAAGLTLGIGQILFVIVRPIWARLLIALVFVAPAVMAGYHATHGIVKHTMPSETWQIAFSVIGAIAVGIFRHRRDRCRHHCTHAGHRHGGHRPGRSRHDVGLIVSPYDGSPDQTADPRARLVVEDVARRRWQRVAQEAQKLEFC